MEFQIKAQQKIARTFASMIERCYNSDSPSYYWYGARGIKICDEWLQDMSAFAADMGFPPALDYSIERIDYNGNYEPSNCRWATAEEQNNNTRRTKLITYNGKTQSLRDWAKEYNIGGRRLSERLRRGWSMEKALNTPCPQGFEGELAKRRDYGNMRWESKGALYSAHSKQKRGHKLNASEQNAIEREKEQATLEAANAFQMQKESEDLATEIENASMFNPTIADLHNAGIASLRISEHLKVPVGVVDLIIDRHNNYSAPLTNSRRKILPSEIYEVLNMRKNGKTIRYIAKSTGIPKSTVHLIISKNLQTQPAL